MTLINKQLAKTISQMLGPQYLEQSVAKEWRKKARCLDNLTNQNKDQLEKLDLKLLNGLTFNDQNAETLWQELKQSKDITPQQNAFAKYLFIAYPAHTLKKMGFD